MGSFTVGSFEFDALSLLVGGVAGFVLAGLLWLLVDWLTPRPKGPIRF